MKKTTFFRFLSLAAVMLLVSAGVVSATTVNHTFTLEGGASGAIDGNISFTTEQNSAGTAPAAYTDGLRIYYAASGDGGSITLIPANGAVINQVKITALATRTPILIFNVDGGSDGEATLSDVTYTIAGISAATSLKIRNGNTTNTQLRISAIEVTYTASGPAVPTLIVNETEIPEMRAEVNASTIKTISVNGFNLTSNIAVVVSGANASSFSIDPASIAPVAGSVSAANIVISYSPLTVGPHSATLTLSSAGATSVIIALTGMTYIPIQPGTIPDIIISEVYGGGGNSGATLKSDFVELYNTTSSAINISGWSVQYYSATGTAPATGNTGVIPEGKIIPAHGYFLIAAAAGTGGTVDLPTADVITALAMSGSAGKVILFNTVDPQTISATDIATVTGNAAFKDYVPFGTTPTPVWGSAMAANATNTTSAQRIKIDGVYSYTQNIGVDFELAVPTPQNSGLTSVRRPQLTLNVVALNGTIRFNAIAGQEVEVYNVIGQKLVSKLTSDGYNIIPLKEKGIMVVKVGNKVSKVIL